MGDTAQSFAGNAYTPTVTGFSSTTELQGTYTLVGKLCSVAIRIVGTSNATGFTITLPFIADTVPIGDGANATYSQIIYCINNGAGIGTAMIRTRIGSSNVCDVYTTAAGAAWTASGSKALAVTFSYYIV